MSRVPPPWDPRAVGGYARGQGGANSGNLGDVSFTVARPENSWWTLDRAPLAWTAEPRKRNQSAVFHLRAAGYSRDLELGVVIYHGDTAYMHPDTLAILEANENLHRNLSTYETTIPLEVTGMPIAVKTDVSDAQLARARKATGRNIQRVPPKYPSVQGKVTQLEAELRQLVEELATGDGEDPARVAYQAQVIAQLAGDVQALQGVVDRLTGHLDSARVLFRGEIQM